MKLGKILLIVGTMLFGLVEAFGGVNIKNGNFYVSYTDLVVPGGANTLKMTRTYNSKSTFVGWFGFGWGSDYETYLETQPDGSLVVFENGGGATTRFTAKAGADAQIGAQKIVDAMKKANAVQGKGAIDLLAKLKNDAELRTMYSKKYKVENAVASGTVLYSNNRGIQQIEVKGDSYVRVTADGKTQTFNKLGKLSKISDKNGYSIAFEYDQANMLKSIKDSMVKQVFFSWYPDGRVKELWSVGDKKASYKFQGQDLVESIDVASNKFGFSYDKNHNLISVNYTDNTKMLIDYDKKTQFVTAVTTKTGDKTSYDYGSDPKDSKNHYWTSVTKNGLNGKPVTNRYEYEIKAKTDGERYTYRILTELSGIKTETVYSECCSLPIKITRGNQVTNFEYDSNGLLLKKNSTKGDFVQLDYDQKLKKISKVTDNSGWTTYSYDPKGNLTKAVNSKGQVVVLTYDSKGKITKMVDTQQGKKENRILSFQYNAMGKPSTIAMDKVGSIQVAYDDYGEIKKVDSKGGDGKLALQVTQAFTNLLNIVKPAGVSLSF